MALERQIGSCREGCVAASHHCNGATAHLMKTSIEAQEYHEIIEETLWRCAISGQEPEFCSAMALFMIDWKNSYGRAPVSR